MPLQQLDFYDAGFRLIPTALICLIAMSGKKVKMFAVDNLKCWTWTSKY